MSLIVLCDSPKFVYLCLTSVMAIIDSLIFPWSIVHGHFWMTVSCVREVFLYR